jgi:membrane protease YdiL (CAAX protease family)
MGKDIFNKLTRILRAIIHGDYSQGAELEAILKEQGNPSELQNFAEKLNLMTVKLEARELALKDNIEHVKKQNALLEEGIFNLELLTNISMVFLLQVVGYIFFLGIIQYFPSINPIVSRVFEVLYLITAILLVRRLKIPLSQLGFQWKGGLRAAGESLFLSFLFFGIFLWLSFYLRSQGKIDPGLPLFPNSFFHLSVFIFLPLSFLQEALLRGVFQTVLETILIGKLKRIFALLIPAGIFASMHLSYSLEIALFTFVLGILWGLLYFRHRTLLGVTLSHWLIGSLAWMMGIWDIFSRQAF